MSSITVSGVVKVTLAERRSVPKSPSKGSTGAEKSNTTYNFYQVPLHTWDVRHYPANFKDVFFDKQHFDGLSPPPHVKKYTFDTTNTIDDGRFVYMSGVMHAGIPVDGPGKFLIDAHRLDPFPGDISSESYADQFPPDAYLDAVITVIIVADEVVFDLSFPQFKNMCEISANSTVQVTGIIVGVLDECLAVLTNGYTLGIGSKASGIRDPLAVPKPVPVLPKR
ncbi:hypothetical protein BKA62DRAFT_830899 [Auriculariales sp. MPI-PUGE-AT-0066]|nr:hypothetical protein BKA62DRAFT_830899 [Auriculariales sp. MPI-PUGE-AT-0066]